MSFLSSEININSSNFLLIIQIQFQMKLYYAHACDLPSMTADRNANVDGILLTVLGRNFELQDI